MSLPDLLCTSRKLAIAAELPLANKNIRPPVLPTAGEQEKLFASANTVPLAHTHARSPAVCLRQRR